MREEAVIQNARGVYRCGLQEDAAPATFTPVDEKLVVSGHDEFQVEEDLLDATQHRLHLRRRVLDDLQRAPQTFERGFQIDIPLAGRSRFKLAVTPLANEHLSAQHEPPFAVERRDR